MASESALLTGGAVTQGRECDLAGERIDPKHKSTPADVERRFMLPASIARTVVGIARAAEASWSDHLLTMANTSRCRT